MRGNDQPDGRPLGGWELRTQKVLFLPFVDQSTPKWVCLCWSVRSLQHRFPIDDILLRSRDIRDQVAK